MFQNNEKNYRSVKTKQKENARMSDESEILLGNIKYRNGHNEKKWIDWKT